MKVSLLTEARIQRTVELVADRRVEGRGLDFHLSVSPLPSAIQITFETFKITYYMEWM